MNKDIADAFKAIDELNPSSSLLSDNALSIVDTYIDTGCLALNGIVSGSLYGGVPQGRITGLVGPSGSGKSLILNKIIANAQKKDPDVWGIIWDSENATDRDMAVAMGADVSRIKHNPIETVEDCRNQMAAFLSKVQENKSLHGKIVIGLDSLGNLSTSKEMGDVAKGKDAAEMGLKAKSIRSFMRVMTHLCAATKTTFIFTNHIYDDPAAMYPSLVKKQSGGMGPLYLASVLLQLAVRQEKNEGEKDNDAIIPIANKVKGIAMRAMTIKNRFVPPFLETELYLNFKSGLSRYAGLVEMAKAFKIIEAAGPSWKLDDGSSLGYFKDWKNNKTVWEEKILPKLEAKLKEQLTFAQEPVNNELIVV